MQKVQPGLPNHTLAHLAYKNLELVGPPDYCGSKTVAVARQIQENLGLTAMHQPFWDVTRQLIDPTQAEREFEQTTGGGNRTERTVRFQPMESVAGLVYRSTRLAGHLDRPWPCRLTLILCCPSDHFQACIPKPVCQCAINCIVHDTGEIRRWLLVYYRFSAIFQIASASVHQFR